MDSDPDDYWAQAVTSYTGYPMPKRTSLFDKLKSKEGIPLMRVHLVEHDMRAVKPEDYTAVSGWQASHGEDYRLAFYTHHDGQSVKLYTADIVFIGTLADADGKSHLSDAGSTREGGAFKGKYGDEWNDTDLWRYVSAPKFAFEKLVNEPYSTKNFSYNGVSVPDANAVDLVSFTRTAQAFDRAAAFFRRQLKPLEEWNKSLGGDDAAWKGQSADVVRTLIQTLHKNYESYVEQMGGREFKSPHQLLGNGYPAPESKYSEALFQAQWDLLWEAKMMAESWQRWADSAEHDPHRALLEELDALSDWIIHNNVPLVTVDPDSLGSQYGWSSDDDGDEDLRYTSETSFDTLPGFSDSHPDMGLLSDLNSWKKLGENAVKRWNANVDGYLVAAAKQSLSNLGKSWSDASEDAGQEIQSKETDNLSNAYQKEETKSEKDASKKALDDANKKTSQAWDNLNKNLSDSNSNNKSLFDNLNQNLADSNNNQKQLNSGLNGLGNSLSNGLSGLGDNFSRSLNPDGLGGGLNPEGLGGGLNPNGDGKASLLNGGLDTPDSGPGGADSLLNNGTTLPFSNFTSLNPDTSTGNSSPLNLNPGSLTDGPHLDADGNLVQTYPDGTKTVFNPDTGQLVTTAPNGHTTTTRLNPGDLITNPDGSHTRLNADGTLTTEAQDGTKTVFDPSDGTLHTTKPDGHTTTTHLNKPIDMPDLSGGGSNLSHGGTSPLNDTHLDTGHGYSYDDADADYLDYDSTPFTGGTLGGGVGGLGIAAANHNSAASGGGTPLNPGLGGGGDGAGGAGAGGANGERVRTALNDAGNLSALRRNGAAAPAIDGEAMPFRRGGTQTTSSPMGGAPMGGMQGGQSTESAERQRTNWVEEDEDVWGTEEGGAPAVIG